MATLRVFQHSNLNSDVCTGCFWGSFYQLQSFHLVRGTHKLGYVKFHFPQNLFFLMLCEPPDSNVSKLFEIGL